MLGLADYILGKSLHSTKNSQVYAGVRGHDQAPVVLKAYVRDTMPHGESRASWEFEVLRSLEGVGTPRPLEIVDSSTGPVLVLERMPGVSLWTWVDQQLPSIEAVLEVAIQLTSTLARVHAIRMIHRDVNPSNVLVDPSTLATYLLDFGLACRLGASKGIDKLSSHATGLAGTLRYMPPEQTGRMGRGIDTRSDLYSVGATIYFALTGRAPFECDDVLTLMHAHMARRPASPGDLRPELPPALSRIVLKLLAKQPEDRYQTANGLCVDLQTCHEHLRRNGGIPVDLPLGSADAPLRPLFRRKVYGRDAEVSALRTAYARSRAGKVQLVLLSGPPGVGKSALVHELRPALAETGGYLAEGKFDSYRRDVPYTAISAALGSFVQQILTESDARLQQWRRRLHTALGEIAAALIELVPDVACVLGDVPSVPELGAQESQLRLALATRRFVRACARAGQPLVLFLDDLQWCDPGSRFLIEEMMSVGERAELLVIVAYRDSEVAEGHPLRGMIARLRERQIGLTQICLAPIDQASVVAMLSDALGRSVGDVQALAEGVVLKTGGSPLLIQQFIQHMHSEGLVRFAAPGGWLWDDTEIVAARIPDDAVALMIAKLQRLEEEPEAVLQIASCVGDEFGAEVLAELSERPQSALEEALFDLADEGLIAPFGDGFRFVHDRVREAVHALLSPHARAQLHYRIAQLLLQRIPEAALPDRAFQLADHLNRAAELLSDAERVRAIDLNRIAGRRALATGAAAAASSYLAAGRTLLRETDWEHQRALGFDLLLQSAQAAHDTGDFETIFELCDALDPHCRGSLDFARVEAKRITATAFARGREDALRLTLAALRRLGIRWSARPHPLRVLRELVRMDWLLRGSLIGRCFEPADPDRSDWIAPVLILGAGGATLARTSPALVCLAAAFSLRLFLRHGALRAPSFALAAYAVARAAAFPDRPTRSARYVQAALDWAQRDGHLGEGNRASILAHAFVLPWIKPRPNSFEPLLRAAVRSLERGDLEYAYLALNLRAALIGLSGRPLAQLDRAIAKAKEILRGDPHGQLGRLEMAYGHMREEPADLEQVRRELVGAHDLLFYELVHWLPKLCILGLYREAYDTCERLRRERATGTTPVDLCFYRGLSAAVLASRSTRRSQRRPYRRALRTSLRRIRRWAGHGPDYVHMLRLLEAEQSRLRGQRVQAETLYQQAGERAQSSGYLHHAGLAQERRASLLVETRRHMAARDVLGAAARLYEAYGATCKVAEMEATHDSRG